MTIRIDAWVTDFTKKYAEHTGYSHPKYTLSKVSHPLISLYESGEHDPSGCRECCILSVLPVIDTLKRLAWIY